MPRISPNALSLMFVTAMLESLLAVYQWMELILVKSGGIATCALNETVNCGTVWTSDFAHRVHGIVGMPVAGLGLVWGVTAFGLTVVVARKLVENGDASGPIAAAKIWAALGALSCITFGVASFKIGAVCLTCLATYALTIGFALPVLLLLPKSEAYVPGASWIASMALPVFLLLLYPGSQTPKGTGTAPAAVAAAADRPKDEAVQKYFASLQWAEAQAAADAKLAWQQAPMRDTSKYPVHARFGPPDAAVKLVEFTDILCGHCRALVGNLASLKKAVPAADLSIEVRYFPLDSECNKKVHQTAGDGVRCLGAKAQICLEGSPQFWALREEMFDRQEALGKDLILEIASKGMPRDVLEQCIASPATQARIDEDVEYALLYELQGTPLVLLNQRELKIASPAFLYGMVLAKGDVTTKFFDKLPPGR